MTNEEKWERQERWETCARYIRKTGSLAEAQALAKKDGITFNTSVWITAMGKILEAKV